jgi:hypothetical protein
MFGDWNMGQHRAGRQVENNADAGFTTGSLSKAVTVAARQSNSNSMLHIDTAARNIENT